MSWLVDAWRSGAGTTPDGLRVAVTVSGPTGVPGLADPMGIDLRLESARLRLLRGYDELLCLDGLQGVEQLPHQIETVRRVLRQFRGRVLLADEVGLGKTIEACLLMREYLLRGLAKRVLVLVPANLVPQWAEELEAKFRLSFMVAEQRSAAKAGFWKDHDRVLTSLSLAKSKRFMDEVAAVPWDLVVVDEAHHCKNRNTRNFQLVNSLRRRFCFLLSATPVQNDLLELYNLLTLLEPGHLRSVAEFKRCAGDDAAWAAGRHRHLGQGAAADRAPALPPSGQGPGLRRLPRHPRPPARRAGPGRHRPCGLPWWHRCRRQASGHRRLP